MATYRVEEVDETPIVLHIILYALLFTILLPIGIGYLIYKIIKYFIDRKKRKQYEEALEDARFEENLRIQEKERRELQNEAADRLLKLKALYDNGIISDEEYASRRERELHNL